MHGWRHAYAVTRSSCMSRSAPRSVSQHVVYVAKKRRSTRYVTWRGDTWRCVPRCYLCIHINSKDKDRKGCDVWQRQNPSLEFPSTICSRSPRRRARRRRPARRKAMLALSSGIRASCGRSWWRGSVVEEQRWFNLPEARNCRGSQNCHR